MSGYSAVTRYSLGEPRQGHTQRKVAEELGLSLKTVESYRARIKHKLGLHTRTDLVAFALKSGVLRVTR